MEGRGWRIGDLGSSLRNILVILIIVGIYLRKAIKCQSRRPKFIAMRAHIPSRNAQPWLLLYSAQVTQCVDSQKGHSVVIAWSRAPVEKGAQSESRRCKKRQRRKSKYADW